jgi:8-oxo-dGTP diphosphatase
VRAPRNAEDKDTVQAAGGILWRPRPEGTVEVAVVHRPKYDDWTLPKGKLDPGESHEDAALREVEEETGHTPVLGEPVGSTRYLDAKGRPKEARYWDMRPVSGRFRPTDEVDELRWLPVEEAGTLLTYDHDRELLLGWQPPAAEAREGSG